MCRLTGELRENKKCFLTNNTTQDIIGTHENTSFLREKKSSLSVEPAEKTAFHEMKKIKGSEEKTGSM